MAGDGSGSGRYLREISAPGGVVLWGKGFEVDRAGSLPWERIDWMWAKQHFPFGIVSGGT